MNPKIVGATIVGFALVFGAYITSDYLSPGKVTQTQVANVDNVVQPTYRQPIEVTDNDNNGIEDWKDPFVEESVVINQQTGQVYTPPTTLTGKIGTELIETLISSKVYAPYGNNPEEIINNAAALARAEVEYKLYDIDDIDIIEDWNDDSVVNYANTMASTIIRYDDSKFTDISGLLNDIIRNNKVERLPELEALIKIFEDYRNDSLKTPVPEPLVKEHLDMINTLNAIYENLSAFLLYETDPIITLMHISRYDQDREALVLVFENMYDALLEYADLFDEEDPAVLFLLFSPDYQNNA